jgi:tetratricopeptide (TPR) repeat protein
VEARLLLIDLLSLEGAGDDLEKEIALIGELLSGYPGFWQAWSRELAARPEMRDAALAIRFLEASLQGRPITWTTVIQQGLASFLSEAAPAKPVADRSAPRISASQPAEDTPSSPLASPADAAVETAEDPEEEEAEEAFSLRTRSMAEVLAEQGDLASALDIYQEIIQSAPEEERGSLEARAEELSRRMTTAGTGPQDQPTEAGDSFVGENNRLIGILETLAKRLEVRAR